MKIISDSDFQKNTTKYLNRVNNTREPLIISRNNGKSVIIIDFDEYNTQQETAYLLSNKANRSRREAALKEMESCINNAFTFHLSLFTQSAHHLICTATTRKSFRLGFEGKSHTQDIAHGFA